MATPKKKAPAKKTTAKTPAKASSKASAAAAAAAAPAPVAPAPPPGPPAAALAMFERGMTALQKHAYDRAAEAFDALIAAYPAERTLLDRARVYRDLCAREMRRQPAESQGPTSSEERLTMATLALNNGRDVEAENLAKRVLAEDPKQDLAAYLLASIEARRGHTDRALEFLGQAIRINPDSRAQARHDEDFAALQDLDVFKALTELAPRTVDPAKPVAKRGR